MSNRMSSSKSALTLFAAISTIGTLAPAAEKTFIDYFLPTPIHGHLTADAWGAPNVLPRDPQNGLEVQSSLKWWAKRLSGTFNVVRREVHGLY